MTTPANPQPTSTDDAERDDLLSMMLGLDGLSAQHLADAILAAGFRRAPATEAGEDKAALWKEAAELRALAFDAKSKAYDQARAEADALRKALADVAFVLRLPDMAQFRDEPWAKRVVAALAAHPAASATTSLDEFRAIADKLAADAVERADAEAHPAPQPARAVEDDLDALLTGRIPKQMHNMCRNGHQEIRYSADDSMRCPLCDALASPPTAAAGVTESWTPEQWVAASSAGYDELAKCGSHPSPRFVRMAIAAGIAAALAAAQMRTGE